MTDSDKQTFLIRKKSAGLEIETRVDEKNLDNAYLKLEELWAHFSQLDEELEPKRKIRDLVKECQKYWVRKDGKRYLAKDVASVSHRVGLSVLDGGNKGKSLKAIADETGLSSPLARYHLTDAKGASGWCLQDEKRHWKLTPEGLEHVTNIVIPYLQGRHGNELHMILKWMNNRIYKGQFDSWILGKVQGKVDKTNFLEYAVGLLLSALGFLVYQVGMYNDRFDIVACPPDGSIMLVCDCTTGSVRKKSSGLSIVVEELRTEFPEMHVEGVVFTTERISKTDRKDLLSDKIGIVDATQIKELLKLAKSDRNPELLFDVMRKKETR